MMRRGNSSFLFVAGMVRALEKRLIGRPVIESMLRADSVDGIAEILKNTAYSTWIEKAGREFRAADMISSMRSELYSFIEKYSYGSGAGALFRLDYDYYNMKVLLKKNIFTGQKMASLSELGNFGAGFMEDIFAEERYGSLPSIMGEAVSSAIEAYYSVKKQPVIDLVMDIYLFRDLLERGAVTGEGVVERYIRRRIDIVNILTLLRNGGKSGIEDYMSYLFIDGGFISTEEFINAADDPLKTLKLIALKNDLDGISEALNGKEYTVYAAERECRAVMLDELEPADFMITGVEPLFAYGCRADDELRNVGMIFASKAPGFDRGAADILLGAGGVI